MNRHSKVLTLAFLASALVFTSNASVIDVAAPQIGIGTEVLWDFVGGSKLSFYGRTEVQDGYRNVFAYDILRDGQPVQQIAIRTGFESPLEQEFQYTLSDRRLTIKTNQDEEIVFEVDSDTEGFLLLRVTRRVPYGDVAVDCLNLESEEMNWFGGVEQQRQFWPVEQMHFENYGYVSKELYSAALSERYWLNSRGVFVYVNERTPLFINQNTLTSVDKLCFEVKAESPYYYNSPYDYDFEYSIGVALNPRLAQMKAVEHVLGKPNGIPDADMVRFPIWSTWVRYGRDITEEILINYVTEIQEHGFKLAQLEIDDMWEECYGAFKLASKFEGLKDTITLLRNEKGVATTLWIHPFVNENCQPYYNEARDNGYLLQSYGGAYQTRWWNSADLYTAAYIDFTNPAAREWFRATLTELKEATGVDSFKFDAGEPSFGPENPRLTGPLDLSPSIYVKNFLDTVSEFGPKLEIRVGQGTQYLPHYIRILDLDSRWTMENGLPTMIPTVLLFNLVGYPFVLPDMIGGNNYEDDIVSKELYIRWIQANVFMPVMQFSITPWDFDTETIALAKHFTELHEQYAPTILERFNLAVWRGEPVNPPIWWLDPEDRVAHKINDEFLLGEDVLAAPVVKEGQVKRDIYLPKGTWIDGNNANVVYEGPTWLLDYDAPLNILPYFLREN